MGLKLFSSSIYDIGEQVTEILRPIIKTQMKESYENYSIIKHISQNNYLLIMIQYHDHDNYEGKKILLFKNVTKAQLLKQKVIDPHFSENKNYYSPIARFEPTNDGWNMGKMLISNIITKEN